MSTVKTYNVDSGDATSLTLKTNGTTAVTVDSSQNVGIGTATPTEKLDVSGNLRLGASAYLKIGTGFSSYIQGTTNTLTFGTNSTDRVTIDSSGNVGIGTASPGAILHTIKTSAGAATVGAFIQNSDTTVGTEVRLGFAANINTVSDNRYGWIGYVNTGGTNGGALTFATTPGGTSATERARIDSSGNLLVGTTSTIGGSGGVFQVKGAASATAVVIGIGTDGQNGIRFMNSAGSQVGTIVVNTSSTAYNTSSDYRLKENIAPMTGALAKVAALKPVTYKWKADGSDGEGFIAHELAEVCPDAVTGEKDAVDADGNPVYQGIDTSFLVATLTAAIQEQQAIIEQLKADVAALKGKV